jgi:hypothetical protein
MMQSVPISSTVAGNTGKGHHHSVHCFHCSQQQQQWQVNAVNAQIVFWHCVPMLTCICCVVCCCRNALWRLLALTLRSGVSMCSHSQDHQPTSR